MRILLVDDEAELVETLVERLRLRGIDADCALSGDAAIDMTQSKAYDLAVVDMKMPGTSGLDVMKSMRDMRPEMRFIFLTGHGSTQDCQEGRKAGASDYLMKPVRLQVLLERIQAALNPGGEENNEC
ncbi:response regulator [Desulfobaculum senezii]|uniref:response regulator n=1 Tax=Desulfobaculum sp. SPO524 TaxID=3378071 RepID=UPI003853D8E9